MIRNIYLYDSGVDVAVSILHLTYICSVINDCRTRVFISICVGRFSVGKIPAVNCEKTSNKYDLLSVLTFR